MALAPEHYEKGVAGYLQHYEALHNMCPVPFEGIKELLIMLQEKGVRIAMVTGKGKYSTEISLKYLELASHFEIIETGSPTGPCKAEGIQHILDNFQSIPKDEVIYIGDAPSDVKACRKAGITIIAAAWAETAEPEALKSLGPDHLFYTIQDLSHWLKDRT
jgi:phosphoglycolate phosphatase/pyrophosphatase PpaX